jgi:hypothetical protein
VYLRTKLFFRYNDALVVERFSNAAMVSSRAYIKKNLEKIIRSEEKKRPN